MKSSRNALIFVAICLAVLAIISAYLAYSQANILDRYIKRLLVEPDFSQFAQNNGLIIGFSIAHWLGQYFCWWLMSGWLARFLSNQSKSVWRLIPIAQVLVTYKKATKAWNKYEYLAREADEYHRSQPWVRFTLWFWSLVVALPIIAAGFFKVTPPIISVRSSIGFMFIPRSISIK